MWIVPDCGATVRTTEYTYVQMESTPEAEGMSRVDNKRKRHMKTIDSQPISIRTFDTLSHVIARYRTLSHVIARYRTNLIIMILGLIKQCLMIVIRPW